MSSKKEKSAFTFDHVFKSLLHWRNNKSQYESRGIPDNVWEMIFQLERSGYSGKDLKRAFSINSKQYAAKKKQLSNDHKMSIKKEHDLAAAVLPDEHTNVFCEAKITPDESPTIPALVDAAKKTKRAVETLKSTSSKPQDYLDMNTIIVEYTRPDGHRLKIHTTSASIDKVMTAFAQQGVQTND